MKKPVIVSAIRTPIGKFGKSLSMMTAPDLAAVVIKETIERNGINPNEVDELIFGNLLNFDNNNVARIAWLSLGYPEHVPASIVNRRCASSLTALANAAMMIETDNAEMVLAGGVESYSQNPFMVKRPEKAYPATLNVISTRQAPDGEGNVSLLQTAENIAQKYKLTRLELDEFSYRSHMLASKAWDNKKFDNHVIPVVVDKNKNGGTVVNWDDCIRKDTTVETLGKLRPVVSPSGVVTAGNSSPMNDGASCMLVMSEEKALSMGLKPMAYIKEFAISGCNPAYMGLGPIYSTDKLFKTTGLSFKDIDLIEINEAFASQSIACLKEMNLYNSKDMERINVNGGAIAIGHPNAASGGILVARLISEMRDKDLKRGLVTFCIGGGQGMSIILENYK